MVFNKFNSAHCRNELHLACNRAKIYKNKIRISITTTRVGISQLLAEGKEEIARIKAERLLHDQKLEHAYEELQMFCEILGERIAMIDNSKTCPSDLVSVIHSVLYCESRTKIAELGKVKKEFSYKFGKSWVQDAVENRKQEVHYKLVHSLSLVPPIECEIVKCLTSIAKEYNVDWTPPAEKLYTSDMLFKQKAKDQHDFSENSPSAPRAPSSMNTDSSRIQSMSMSSLRSNDSLKLSNPSGIAWQKENPGIFPKPHMNTYSADSSKPFIPAPKHSPMDHSTFSVKHY